MHASEQYGIQRDETDDWFDTILDNDTELFVDPFLIFKETAGFWADAHALLIDHFNTCFLLIASSGGNPDALAYKKALALLMFREPKEMCLGYTSQGTRGSGSGAQYARGIAEGISEAIARGVKSIRHFEELGIFNEGLGPDRISDMACTILKPKIVAYTQEIALKYGIPADNHRYFPAEYNAERQAWYSGEAALPTNPFSQGPLLLIPERFLRELPTLNADDWWHSYEAERLRTDLSYEVLGKVDKPTIVATARRHAEMVEHWAQEMEGAAPQPYDLSRDPKGVYLWDRASRAFAAANPLQLEPPQSIGDFMAIVERVIDHFRLYIEENGGWRLLWNDDGSEKHEGAAQLLFAGVAKSYCRANNIEVDREVELGRGPVDFKFANGFRRRALLEVKKLHNGKFWDGLEAQLPSYCVSDECSHAWFLALHYREDGISVARSKALPDRIQALAEKTGLVLRYGYADARPKASASNLTAED